MSITPFTRSNVSTKRKPKKQHKKMQNAYKHIELTKCRACHGFRRYHCRVHSRNSIKTRFSSCVCPCHVSAVSTSQQTKPANSSGFWRYEPHMWPRPVLKRIRIMVFTRQNDLSCFLFFVLCLAKLLVRIRRKLKFLEFFRFLTNNRLRIDHATHKLFASAWLQSTLLCSCAAAIFRALTRFDAETP